MLPDSHREPLRIYYLHTSYAYVYTCLQTVLHAQNISVFMIPCVYNMLRKQCWRMWIGNVYTQLHMLGHVYAGVKMCIQVSKVCIHLTSWS